MFRRKTTPKRLRLDLNLSDEDEVPPFATFVDEYKVDSQNGNAQSTAPKINNNNVCPAKNIVEKTKLAQSASPSTTSLSSSITSASSYATAQVPKSSSPCESQTNIKQVPRKNARKNPAPPPQSSRYTPLDSCNETTFIKLGRHEPMYELNKKTPRQNQNNQVEQPCPPTATVSSPKKPPPPDPPVDQSSGAVNNNAANSASKPKAKSVNNQLYLVNKTHFNWSVYLELCPAEVAPKEAFRQTYGTSLENKFEPGMKLEARDPRNETSWCLATVISKEGPRIRLRLDGSDKMNDFFELIDSDNIRPCNSKPDELLYAPVGYRGDISNYSNFVHKIFTNQNTSFAAEDIFVKSPPKPKTNMFKPGMKLESVDKKNPHMICPSTVARVIDDLHIRVIFDGWPEAYGHDCCFDSRDIFPINWCRDNQHQIVPPYRWDKFLEDGQPLIDIDKILKSAAEKQPTNNNGTRLSTGTPRSRRSAVVASEKKVTDDKKKATKITNIVRYNQSQEKKKRQKEKKKQHQEQQKQLKQQQMPVNPEIKQVDTELTKLPETSALIKTITKEDDDDDVQDTNNDEHDEKEEKQDTVMKSSSQETQATDVYDLNSTSPSLSIDTSSSNDVEEVWSTPKEIPIILKGVDLIPASVVASANKPSNV